MGSGRAWEGVGGRGREREGAEGSSEGVGREWGGSGEEGGVNGERGGNKKQVGRACGVSRDGM